MYDKEKRIFKVGEALIANTPFDIETEEGETIHVENGEVGIVGFDDHIHLMKHNVIESIDDTGEVKGLSSRGLSTYITAYLDHNMNLSDMLKDKNCDCDMFIEYLVSAFKSLGLPDDLENKEEK